MRVRLVGYEPDLERVCAAAMRSCYSPHPGYKLFTNTSQDNVLDGEKIFDAERIGGLLKRALELGQYEIGKQSNPVQLYQLSRAQREPAERRSEDEPGQHATSWKLHVRPARDKQSSKPPDRQTQNSILLPTVL